jgi:hypothetical protein
MEIGTGLGRIQLWIRATYCNTCRCFARTQRSACVSPRIRRRLFLIQLRVGCIITERDLSEKSIVDSSCHAHRLLIYLRYTKL